MKLKTHKGFSVVKEFQWEVPYIVLKLSAIIAELHRQNTSLFASMKALTLDPQISAWLSEHDPKGLEQAQESIAKVESWRSRKQA
jgi:hypothetical protein